MDRSSLSGASCLFRVVGISNGMYGARDLTTALIAASFHETPWSQQGTAKSDLGWGLWSAPHLPQNMLRGTFPVTALIFRKHLGVFLVVSLAFKG